MKGMICEIRYCPECGTEIFFFFFPGRESLFYLSEQMDQPIEMCPQCRLDLREMSRRNLDSAPQAKRGSPRKKAAGKKEIVDELLETAGTEFSSKASAERAVDAVRDVIIGLAKAGTDIRWAGVGSFKIKERKARRVRNPRTGEMMRIPAKKALKFSPAKRLKEQVAALSWENE